MESSVALLILIIILCIITSAFFSSSETALFSLNKYKLKTAVDNEVRGSASAKWLLDQPERLISTILICNNIVNIVASALATVVGQELSGDLGIAIATGLLTFFLLMFAEIIPKTIASKFPEEVAYNFSPILKVVFKVFVPLVWFFNVFTTLFFRLVKINQSNGTSSLSNDELRIIVKESQKLVGKDHSDMLNSILDLEELTVEDVMTPRHEVIGIDIDDDMKTIMRRINHSPVSRVVVYRESFDEQIIGTLRIKEFYRLIMETGEETKETLLRAVDEPNFIPDTVDLTRQLYSFKQKKRKFALVADEYGSFVGIITIDDILEEIVGNFTINSIVDEEEDIALISSGKYVIDGQANIRDLNRKFGWKLDDEEARTLNGFILEHYQDIPKAGSTFQSGSLLFKVLEANALRILDVEIIDTKRYKGNFDKKTEATVVYADGHLSADTKEHISPSKVQSAKDKAFSYSLRKWKTGTKRFISKFKKERNKAQSLEAKVLTANPQDNCAFTTNTEAKTANSESSNKKHKSSIRSISSIRSVTSTNSEESTTTVESRNIDSTKSYKDQVGDTSSIQANTRINTQNSSQSSTKPQALQEETARVEDTAEPLTSSIVDQSQSHTKSKTEASTQAKTEVNPQLKSQPKANHNVENFPPAKSSTELSQEEYQALAEQAAKPLTTSEQALQSLQDVQAEGQEALGKVVPTVAKKVQVFPDLTDSKD